MNALASFSDPHTLSYRPKGAQEDKQVSAANILIGAFIIISLSDWMRGVSSHPSSTHSTLPTPPATPLHSPTHIYMTAVGGRPAVPANVPGAVEHAVTSDDLFTLPKPPGMYCRHVRI